jgi:hypothetical protein
MIEIISKKNTGKTRKLMEACAEAHGIFVCANPYAAKEKSRAYGIVGIQSFIDYNQYLTDIIEDIENTEDNYFVDDIEKILPSNYSSDEDISNYLYKKIKGYSKNYEI